MRAPVKARIRKPLIVKRKIPSERDASFGQAVEGVQIDLFVFDNAPQPFGEYIIALDAFAVHADGNFLIRQNAGEVGAGELTAVVRVDYLWHYILCLRLFVGFDAEFRFHGNRWMMRKNTPRKDIDDRH